MAIKRMRLMMAAAGLGCAISSLTGCQTQLAGMTLPSGYYLQHRPQYFPTEPDFPLTRELATMQAQGAAAESAVIGGGRLPPPVTSTAPVGGANPAGPGTPAVPPAAR